MLAKTNALNTSTNQINIKIKADTAARDLQNIFKAFQPQFYTRKTAREIAAEQSVINAAITDIAVPVLVEMARLAVAQYKVARGFNKQTYFNLDYFLDFFVEAFNLVNYYVPDCRFKVLNQSLSGNLETVAIELESGKQQTLQRYIEIKQPSNSAARFENERYYSELYFKSMIDELDLIDL